jgi:hypothetical protein
MMMNHNAYLFDLPFLIIVVSLVYSATRFDQWGNIFRESLRWMVRLTGFLGIIGVVLFVVSKF